MIAFLASPFGRAMLIAAAMIGTLALAAGFGAKWQADRGRAAALKETVEAQREERAATERLLDAAKRREAELLASNTQLEEKADALEREARARPAADRRLVRDRERVLAIRPRGAAADPAARRGRR